MSNKGKMIEVKSTALEAIDCCASSIEELAEEMSSWRDSLEDKFSSTDKYVSVSETADLLENTGVRDHCDEIEAAIDMFSGQEFLAGCPPHVVGQRCERCRWDGRPSRPDPEPTFEVCDREVSDWHGGKRREVAIVHVGPNHTLREWASIGADEEGVEMLRARARTAFEQRHAQWEKHNAPDKLVPARLPDDPAVPAIEELQEIGAIEISWQELQPYRGKSKSRADRLGDAVNAGTQGIEAMRAAIEAYEAAHPVAEGEERDERIDELLQALDDLEQSLEEVGNAEFPGMYG